MLLLGEFLWLANRFTTSSLPESDEAWVRWMQAAHYLPQVGLAVLTMLLLFRRIEVSPDPIRSAPRPRPFPRLAALFLAQVLAFVGFARSSSAIFEEHLVGVERPQLVIALWMGLALATIGLGVLFFQPLPALLRGLRDRAGLLFGGCILGLGAWAAGQYAANELSLMLRVPTLWLSDILLGCVESNYLVDVVSFDIRTFDPAPGFWVHIAPSCSGFEGIGLMTVFSASYVWFFRGRLRFPQFLLLPLLGIAGMWLLNVFRIVALVLIGTHLSPGVAEGGFHSLAGTLAFCIAALVLVAASTRLHFFSAAVAEEPTTHERDDTAAYLVPFLAAVAIGMVASALGEHGQVLQWAKVIVPAAALWIFRRRYAIAIPRGPGTALVLGAVAFAIWVGIPRLEALSSVDTPIGRPAAAAGSLAGSLWLPIRILGSICVAPLVEELAFRGYLMRRLTAGEFERVTARQVSILAWAISSLLFGVLHGHWVAATLAGALYGFAYMRRGQLFDCIVAHALTNILLVVLALMLDDWSLL